MPTWTISDRPQFEEEGWERWTSIFRSFVMGGLVPPPDGTSRSMHKARAILRAGERAGLIEHRKEGPAQSSPSWYRLTIRV